MATLADVHQAQTRKQSNLQEVHVKADSEMPDHNHHSFQTTQGQVRSYKSRQYTAPGFICLLVTHVRHPTNTLTCHH
jgi:hypothetical protein